MSRSAVRALTALASTALALTLAALVWAPPASAHGGATVTIHSDGRGSVWITAQWQDGHPINEPTPVTLTATPAADAAGSAVAAGSASPIAGSKLTQTGDERGTQTWSGALPPGAWRVAIDLGPPVEGHCQALVPSVPEGAAAPTSAGTGGAAGGSPQPVEVACLIPATGATGPAGSEPSSTGGSLVPLWVTLGVLLVAGAVAAEVVHRRRRRDRDATRDTGAPKT